MIQIKQCPSDNFGPRRNGATPNMVVIHYTAMANAQAAIDRLCDPEFEVSAHYVISETGEISQLVQEDMRAWHAGAGRWGDVVDVNSHSIGIELANAGSTRGMPPFPLPQMSALCELLGGIMDRWKIPAARVIGHSDMAPLRKADPGPKFDWQGLAARGLSIWPESQTDHAPDPEHFKRDAVQFGYDPDLELEAILSAFRLRFRPLACGDLDKVDMGMMASLAARWPVGLSKKSG